MSAQSIPVSVHACAKTFADGTRALDPIDLQIEAGETIALLGPSGCGKTTLLRLIAGLEVPDPGGRILYDGEDVTRLAIERRNVGMVFQSYALFPNMTVRENVAYGLKVRRTAAREVRRRVDHMLEMMHIDELGHRRVDQLSGGQRQRVALARAIAVRPRVLLLDEPLTALDALLRERLRGEINGLLRGLGITAIYVTHDRSEAMALGDRIVVMNRGRIAQVGAPRDIYHRPASAFVADFAGTVNRLPAHLLAHCADARDAERASLPPGEPSGPSDFLFRPEDADIVPREDAHFIARVHASSFLGDRTRLMLEGVGDELLVIDCRPRHSLEIGAEIPIRIRPESLMRVPTEKKNLAAHTSGESKAPS
ncbi:ABC transporter ATP-binding protein [Varunaivibrio sulfuroxidans]|uniref:Putative spermidine/putrescine transport system ATP-binding protein n=1 Tax=Varunaivibrio sulfuroxidans TaxID=1773489 RepID=A0A4R3J6H4_9PROT|nr:ABC transporter ATP-binding protein [Varunaivibrio sulfuroxidans]TCS60935.1 putative spermidine/putrescine transport system ATP-binding protein [Varunaivibrio sulfuroxidans]WES31657.1 ABC transporter ATP-binding protein [Varunaivibrio sulfuroxidans]